MTPDEFTNEEVLLNVSEDHILYVHDWGNKDAEATYIYLHGGPGDGCNDGHKRLFDPGTMRVIFIDQRGSGKSTPYGSLKDNTTEHLVYDITKVADHLQLEKFVLVGRSWGCSLALAYAIRNPERVSAIVTGGVFTGNSTDTAFFEEGKFREFYPEAWETFIARTPESHQENPAAYHRARILGADQAAARESAYAYSELELSLLRLDDRHSPQDLDTFDPAAITIEVQYMANNCFMEDNYILQNAGKLVMPVWLVQGRYDVVCPPSAAYELYKKLPNGHLRWTTAGHSNSDRANFDVTKTIIESLA